MGYQLCSKERSNLTAKESSDRKVCSVSSGFVNTSCKYLRVVGISEINDEKITRSHVLALYFITAVCLSVNLLWAQLQVKIELLFVINSMSQPCAVGFLSSKRPPQKEKKIFQLPCIYTGISS